MGTKEALFVLTDADKRTDEGNRCLLPPFNLLVVDFGGIGMLFSVFVTDANR